METKVSICTAEGWMYSGVQTLVLFTNQTGEATFISVPEKDAENKTLAELAIIMQKTNPDFKVGKLVYI